MKYISLLFIFLSFLMASCSSNSDTSEQTTWEKVTHTILALGDSLTAWYGLPADQSYPAQLEAGLKTAGYQYALQNAWISWDTTSQVLARLDWLLEWQKFDLVILCIWANDAFQGKNTDDIEKNLRTILEKIKAKNISILFAGMRAPLNLGGEYGKRYEAIFPKLAKEYNLVFMPFFLEWVALKANLNQDDRIHPTREGYAIIVENLMEILEEENLIKK